ncbi:substrate-binding domain-containing protein [Fluviibacterium sp. DFM31]|uniref:Substrate-binding domain-containing protein n=1 Tax=Meridianimarinicoccus marinus TaxID=3231483 RepID=A0ABV3L4V7_9RHOB
MNLKDLSSLLGLSQTTVSRALNGYPEVSEATRARVLEAAAAHGYRPDSRARSLATGRAMAVGLVVPVNSRHERVNPIFADFIAGAGDVLSARGYDIMLSLASGEDEAETYRSLAARGRVDGVIVQAPLIRDWRIKMLRDLGLPFVVHGRISGEDAAYSWIDMDNRRAFRKATDHLLDLGHSRIALLNGLRDMDFAHRREDGFLQGMAARGLSPLARHIQNAPMTEDFGYAATTAMLEAEDAPTAILTASVLVAFGARRAIEAKGLKVGRDVSIVTHDDVLTYLPNTGDPPMFTATRSSVRRAGEQALEMLLQLIDAPGCGPLQTLMEAELVQGTSSGPVLNKEPHAHAET